MAQLEDQVAERGVSISLSDEAREWMAEHGYKPEFGAREMGRIIHQHIKRPLADMMLFGDLQGGGTARIDLKDGTLTVTAVCVNPKKKQFGKSVVCIPCKVRGPFSHFSLRVSLLRPTMS